VKPLRKLLVVLAALVAFGALRMLPEQRFTEDLRARGLHAPKLEIEVRERLGQTGAVVAFGGLRTLIAALLNLRAFGYFERQDWFRLEETYDTIVTLAPRTRFYWDTGSWHLAYNAAADYQNDTELPPLRRHQKWGDAIRRGVSMLERGIRNNPGDWVLPNRLGILHADRNKIVNFPEAARWFRLSVDNGAPGFVVRTHLYALARIPGREQETLEEVRRLHSDERNRVPTLNCIHFVAETRANPQRPMRERILDSFETEELAWSKLRLYFDRASEGFPQTGVEAALRWLQERVEVPPQDRLPDP
jgi:hypothetical protein